MNGWTQIFTAMGRNWVPSKWILFSENDKTLCISESLTLTHVREYPYKIWPYMVQYLHFRILKFPVTYIHIYLIFVLWNLLDLCRTHSALQLSELLGFLDFPGVVVLSETFLWNQKLLTVKILHVQGMFTRGGSSVSPGVSPFWSGCSPC